VEDYLELLAAGGLAAASRARAGRDLGVNTAAPCTRPRSPRTRASSSHARTQPPETNQARSISPSQATALLAGARQRSALHELLVCLLIFSGLRASAS
jgi:hypothetical protein